MTAHGINPHTLPLPTSEERLFLALTALHCEAEILREAGASQVSMARIAQRLAVATEHLLALAHQQGCLERTALSLRLSE